MDHLNAAEDEEFTDFYETFYVPNNAVLSIAGDFDRKDLKKMIEGYFGPVPRGTKDIPRPTIEEPYKVTEVRDTIWGDDQLPLVLMAYPIPAEGTPDYYAVDLLNTALSGGQSSRLNRAVVDDQELAVFCGAFSFGLEDPGQTIAYAVANIGTDPSDVEDAMVAEINKVKALGITPLSSTSSRTRSKAGSSSPTAPCAASPSPSPTTTCTSGTPTSSTTRSTATWR